VVDDESDIREVASLSLELTEGWTVTTADGGAAGAELARTMRPDIILLDVMMPDRDGPNTFAELQRDETTQPIPVIFLTAKAQAADRDRFLALGVRGVIAKPFDPLTLGKQIKDLLCWT